VSDVHECKHLHEPSADTTSAVASAEKRERSGRCSAVQTLHEPSADMTSAVASAEQKRSAIRQMFMSANTPVNHADAC
jgi:hypothetical protein